MASVVTNETSSEPVEIVPSDDVRPSFVALAWRGALAGAAAGSLIGLLDGLLALRAGHHVVGPGDLPLVLLFYAGFFAPAGLVASIVARWFEWPRRATALLIGVGSAFFFVAAYANIQLLPDWKSGISIGVDVCLVVLAAWWFRRAYVGPGDDQIRMGRWITIGVLCWAGAGAGALLAADESGPAVIAARAREAQHDPPNVLVFLTDTLRADHLGCYGYDRPTSPEIDAFASDAVVFEDCFAPTSWTKPSVASLLTALYPSTHACIQQKDILVPEARSLPEVFQAAGWRTGAFSDNPFISPEFGFGQGFDPFDAAHPSVVANGTLLGKVLFMLRILSLSGEPFGVGVKHYRGVDTLIDGEQGLTRFLDDSGDQPWFAYVQAMEPHLPYEPDRADATAFGYPADRPFEAPPPYNGALPFQTAPDPLAGVKERVIAQYDAEVRGLSRTFGRVLDDLRRRGQYENTIVIFVSDHGEEFHEHGGWTHGHSLHREVVHVPLIVRLPTSLGPDAVRGRGRRVENGCSLLDVYELLTAACEIEDPGYVGLPGTGRLLLEKCRPAAGQEKRRAVLPIMRSILGEVDSGPVRLRSIRQGRWLYIRSQALMEEHTALYDVTSAPEELRDRSEKRPSTVTALRNELGKWMKALKQNALIGRSRELSPEEALLLKGLGYTGHEK
jgi:arylsulfatase A-like enzyme